MIPSPSARSLLGTCFLALAMTAPPASPLSAEAKRDFDGRALFEANCAACHGLTGERDGTVAATLGKKFEPLATLAKRNGGVFPEDHVRRIIDGREELRAHQKDAMPVWGTYFRMRHDGIAPDASTETIIQFLVEYVKSIQVE